MILSEFLENCPPYQKMDIDDLNIESATAITPNRTDILIHCDICDGNRYFHMTNNKFFHVQNEIHNYIYKCKNCESSQKIITVLGSANSNSAGHLTKIGEYPPFGKPTPAKFISMIGPDKDIFLKGRRCENQNLGIGAYAYYRRVVELQKNRIIDQIISICSKYDNMESLIKELEHAKDETQFSKAIDAISINLPNSLLIDGRNPLRLIHKALSKGIHEMSDEMCLDRANSIRVILIELSNRISEILKDEKELKEAIKSLDN